MRLRERLCRPVCGRRVGRLVLAVFLHVVTEMTTVQLRQPGPTTSTL